MAAANFNMEDPSKQEAVRRGHHEYIATAGKHGAYVPRVYKHQEYPKMLGKWPRPELKDFLKAKGVSIPNDIAQQQLQIATAQWDQMMSASVVNNAEEEATWLKANG